MVDARSSIVDMHGMMAPEPIASYAC